MQIDSVKPKVIYCSNHIIIKDTVDFLRDQYTKHIANWIHILFLMTIFVHI